MPDDSQLQVVEKLPDKSIQAQQLKNMDKGSSVFVSSTKRGLKDNKVPGPGAYDANYKHEFIVNTPSGFGTTSFMNERPLSEPNTALARFK